MRLAGMLATLLAVTPPVVAAQHDAKAPAHEAAVDAHKPVEPKPAAKPATASSPAARDAHGAEPPVSSAHAPVSASGKEAAGQRTAGKAPAERAASPATSRTGTTVRVVPARPSGPPTGDPSELAAALSRISQRLNTLPVGKGASGGSHREGKGDAAPDEHRIRLVWRMAVEWPSELTGTEVELDPDESASCTALSIE
jgi:hypothetical protein